MIPGTLPTISAPGLMQISDANPIVQNLLFYNTEQDLQNDQLIQSPVFAGALYVQVTVFQFGVQSGGIWLMAIVPLSDPTSFAPNLALQYNPATQYLFFVNPTYILDLKTLSIPGFFNASLPINAQSGEEVFQLMNNLAVGGSTNGLSNSFTNTIHSVCYLLGYPDIRTQGFDGTLIAIARDPNSSIQSVTVKAVSARPFTGVLVQQPGVWTLVTLPTVVDADGQLAIHPDLLQDGYLRMIYDASALTVSISRFKTIQRLQIIDSKGTVIFDNAPVTGPTFVPIQADIPNDYVPSALHFDGATGLVTKDTLSTIDTGLISFAGWFNFDPSLSGTLEFSQGDGTNQLFIDNALPAATWCHMVGTIDAARNLSFLLINGASVGTANLTGAVPFTVPSNGKKLYIGTDTQGNFWKGDIADLSIWFDYSFITNGGVYQSTVARLVAVQTNLSGVTILKPQNPALSIFGTGNQLQRPYGSDITVQQLPGNLATQILPHIFLSGPASQALQPHTSMGTRVQRIMDLEVYAGELTNSATAPSEITLVPT